MSKIDLTKYGITGTPEIIYNPSYEQLFEAEMDPSLTGYEKGQLTELGAVNVMTGIYTGRSPKDKFFVMDETSKDTVWWTSDEYKNDNKPVTKETWKVLKDLTFQQETLCDGHFLRRQREHPSEDTFHHGSGMAGPFRKEHVHPSH